MIELEKTRYNRQIILPGMGEDGQQKLKNARILVIGCGGLGCPVLQYLAAAGVGLLGLADADIVSESNLQRQIIYSARDIGRLKTEVARERLLAQNSLIEINTHPVLFDSGTSLGILAEYDLVVDCTDNFAARYIISDACVAQGKVMIYGSVFQYEGQAAVLNYKGGATYRDLFPESPNNAAPAATIGVLGVLPGVIGLIQATEALKIVTGVGEVLRQLLLYNALDMSFCRFEMPERG